MDELNPNGYSIKINKKESEIDMIEVDTEEIILNKHFRISYDYPKNEELQEDFTSINNLLKQGFELKRISGGTKTFSIELQKKTFKNLQKN